MAKAKKTKPVKGVAKTKDGQIGPKNPQAYGLKGKAQSMPKFARGGMVGKKGC